MVRALLDGRKTQTRRILKDVPDMPPARSHQANMVKHAAPYLDAYCSERKTAANPRGMSTDWCWWQIDDRQCLPTFRVPYAPGDRLWVREGCVTIGMGHGFDVTHWPHGTCAYLADGKGEWYDRAKAAGAKSRPSIHMPRWASRLTLIVEGVKVERLQEISEADAIAEGIKRNHHGNGDQWCDYPLGSSAAGWTDPRDSFESLWRSLHGPDAWAANPWVCAISFRTINANIDTAGAS